MSQPSLPSVQAYLARLPEGVDSYPQCMIKAAPLVDQLAMKPLPDALLGELPERVVELVRNPPMVSAWIPEVVAMTYSISIRDCFFPPGVGDVAYEAWAYERNRRMLSTRLYRALFLLVSPDRLFKQIGPRWSRMRRGSELEVLEHRAGFVRLQTRYPPYPARRLRRARDEGRLPRRGGARRGQGRPRGATEGGRDHDRVHDPLHDLKRRGAIPIFTRALDHLPRRE
ncbi:MAG: hypothetical protein EVA89_39215 [Sandaracinaceae bacterium]|nr:MAG: hypothetical protein EVA89_39215 [Sandaracinaceae bacterium]